MPTDIHIVPIGDIREHSEQRDCWCQPRIDDRVAAVVVIHNSDDGRELIEQHGVN